jgi:hypothetical protein
MQSKYRLPVVPERTAVFYNTVHPLFRKDLKTNELTSTHLTSWFI